jgi:hypothetical protein
MKTNRLVYGSDDRIKVAKLRDHMLKSETKALRLRPRLRPRPRLAGCHDNTKTEAAFFRSPDYLEAEIVV